MPTARRRRPSTSRAAPARIPPIRTLATARPIGWRSAMSSCRSTAPTSTLRRAGEPSSSLLRSAGLRNQLRELARGVHLAHDVAAADELAADEDLRNRRPVGVLLDALADR